jgi:uncharacterized protein YjbJ (UPF0337 family)
MKGDIRQKWGELTDDDLDKIKGSRDKLIGRLQELRGYTREQAEAEVDDWSRKYDKTYV